MELKLENSKFVIGLAILFIAVFAMQKVGYILGVVLLPIIIGVAGYMIYLMIKK